MKRCAKGQVWGIGERRRRREDQAFVSWRGRFFAGLQIGTIQGARRWEVSIFEQLGMLIPIRSITYYQGIIACLSKLRSPEAKPVPRTHATVPRHVSVGRWGWP